MTIWKLTGSEPVKINGKNSPDGAFGRVQENISELVGKADTLIAGDNYITAFEIYSSLLSKDTSSTYLLQRVEELKSLIFLSGMRKELIVLRLAKFLEIIKKRSRERAGPDKTL